NAAPRDRLQAASRSDRSPLRRGRVVPTQPIAEEWNRPQYLIHPCLAVTRDGGDTDLFFADGSDVRLSVPSPVHLDIFAPRPDLEMPPKAEAPAYRRTALEISPAAHTGALSIRADESAVCHGPAV